MTALIVLASVQLVVLLSLYGRLTDILLVLKDAERRR